MYCCSRWWKWYTVCWESQISRYSVGVYKLCAAKHLKCLILNQVPSFTSLLMGCCINPNISRTTRTWTNSFCMLYLLYALEGIELAASYINKWQKSWNRVFWKLFHIDECNVLAVQHYMNIVWGLPIKHEIDIRRMDFLYKLERVQNSVLNQLFEMRGRPCVDWIKCVQNILLSLRNYTVSQSHLFIFQITFSKINRL